MTYRRGELVIVTETSWGGPARVLRAGRAVRDFNASELWNALRDEDAIGRFAVVLDTFVTAEPFRLLEVD